MAMKLKMNIEYGRSSLVIMFHNLEVRMCKSAISASRPGYNCHRENESVAHKSPLGQDRAPTSCNRRLILFYYQLCGRNATVDLFSEIYLFYFMDHRPATEPIYDPSNC